MRYLCLDTSAGSSVALVDSNASQPVLAASQINDSQSHAEQLAVTIAQVVGQAGYYSLSDADIDYLVVGRGPAPFTGLRAGLITARTLAFSLQKPIIGICSLDALARSVLDRVAPGGEVLVATDARRREVYAAAYRSEGPDGVVCLWGPKVGKASEFANYAAKPGVVVAGAGCCLYPQELPSGADLPEYVSASVLARIADHRLVTGQLELDPVAQTSPLYLRRPDVSVPSVAK